MMSPAVSAGSELMRLSPQVAVVTIGVLGQTAQRASHARVESVLEIVEEIFDGPCSQERQVLSWAGRALRQNASASRM